MKTLRPILADQLSLDLASLKTIDKSLDVIVFCEVRQETDYVPHHPQKIIFLFSAMRHFAYYLQGLGFQVHYVALDDMQNSQSLCNEWQRLALDYDCQRVVMTEPGEWRLLEIFKKWQKQSSMDISILEDDRFLCSHQAFKSWAADKKQLRMEYFYQMMRKKYNILIDADGRPTGGSWNYDARNRDPLKSVPNVPKRMAVTQDAITQDVIALVKKHFSKHFGDSDGFGYEVTLEGAKAKADEFFSQYLPYFGQYQDVMVLDEPFMFHAVLSMYINAGLLNPLELCQRAEQMYFNGQVPIEAAEGFIRQILGWREFVRGIYWLKMPDYIHGNALEAKRALPDLYWGGETKMNCLKQVVHQTWQNAYSHHIQRLMVTGNFALLAGLAPNEVCEWYLAVYLDAYEWVELPNTLGMSLFADGGVLASKPYAASGNYIDKMSNFCKSCQFNPKVTIGEDACPFNALYWNFIAEHESKLSQNHRMQYMYATWRRFDEQKRLAIIEQAKRYLSALEKNQL